MSKDLVLHLSKLDLSEKTVMARSLRTARASQAKHRSDNGLAHKAVKLLTEPDGNIKLSHSGSQKVAAYGLNLLPADTSGAWNTCRYATPGCRSACLATSGQAGMEMRSGKDRIFRARKAKLEFLGADPLDFLRILVHEIDTLKVSKWADYGFTVSLRLNVLSDIPWETLVPWLVDRAASRGIRLYDYTAWPSSKRTRSVKNLYLVDSVKETHTDAQIDAMARPVVVFSTTRKGTLPLVWRCRKVIDADLSDARFLDEEGTVRGLRYKHTATTTRAAAVVSGFIKTV